MPQEHAKKLPTTGENIPIETGLDTPEKALEGAAFNIVGTKVDTLLAKLASTPELVEGWKTWIEEQQPVFEAMMQLAQEPDVQHNLRNLETIIAIKRSELNRRLHPSAMTMARDENGKVIGI